MNSKLNKFLSDLEELKTKIPESGPLVDELIESLPKTLALKIINDHLSESLDYLNEYTLRMNTKIIELKQAPVVLVMVEKEGRSFTILNGLNNEVYLSYFFAEIGHTHRIRLPNGYYRIMGTLSDLTEEQFAGIVDKVNFESGPVYKNYKTFKGLSKASEAFNTLLESEKVYTENPFDQDYEEAQQRTIDPERTVVLLKKNKS